VNIPTVTVEVLEVSRRFRHGGGVHNISFAAAPGEYVALFGGSGSGKSTLLQLLSGRLTADTGTVRMLGKKPKEVQNRIGYLPETPSLPGLFSPHQVLAQRMLTHNVPTAQRAARMAEMLDLFELYPLRDRPLRELSQGQRTAVGMAAVLIYHPPILLLDNVRNNLPPRLQKRLQNYLDAHRTEDGWTLIHATTHSEEAEKADRVLLLEDGGMLAWGKPEALLADYAVDTLTVEAADPQAVQRTLRGIFDVEILETGDGLRFSALDGIAATAHLFRHPAGGVRTVYVRRPNLWDVLERLSTR
jgi:ABC-2 type transport system ATP-binding protein